MEVVVARLYIQSILANLKFTGLRFFFEIRIVRVIEVEPDIGPDTDTLKPVRRGFDL